MAAIWQHAEGSRAPEIVRRLGCLMTTVGLLIAATRPAFAQTATDEVSSASAPLRGAAHRITGIHLDAQSGWSVGMEGYVGLATVSTTDGTKGHAVAGGVSRARFGYAEIGGRLEMSDVDGERWRMVGGFAGAYLPLTNWVDIDTSVGLGVREYVSKDRRYGPGGVSARTPTLTLRIGVSDRTIEGLLGPRLGAALLIGIDLKHHDAQWTYKIPEMETMTGATRLGGVTVGLVMSVGLDVARRSGR